MDAATVVLVVVVLGGLTVAYNFAGRGAQALGGLFHPPGLGWPHGVQEDDDLHWRWSAETACRSPRPPEGRRTDGDHRVVAEPLQGRVKPR
jgi:hypothetical protein